jgi:type IV secretory pathway VirB4 component
MSNNSQQFVPIKEIKDGIILLKDDSLRAVLMASSINLGLKSQEEQEATLLQFQNFLNSLDFPTQIVIQSRRRNIRPYITKLEARLKEQQEPLLKIQTREYIEFIKSFMEINDIMTKHFFVVVPYDSAPINSSSGFLSKILPGGAKNKNEEAQLFEEKRVQLEQRITTIQEGLKRTGVRTLLLKTPQIVELFFKTFNPGEGESSDKFEDVT